MLDPTHIVNWRQHDYINSQTYARRNIATICSPFDLKQLRAAWDKYVIKTVLLGTTSEEKKFLFGWQHGRDVLSFSD